MLLWACAINRMLMFKMVEPLDRNKSHSPCSLTTFKLLTFNLAYLNISGLPESVTYRCWVLQPKVLKERNSFFMMVIICCTCFFSNSK